MNLALAVTDTTQDEGQQSAPHRAISRLALVVTAVVLASSASTLVQAASSSAENAVMAPDFALRSIAGDNLRLSEYRGQVVALGFWARWCGDCRQAMKALNEIYDKYQKAGLVTLGINVDDSLEQAGAMARSLGLNFPILVDEQKTASSLFDLKSMPLIVIIDREGRRRYIHTSFELGDESRISSELRTLLNE